MSIRTGDVGRIGLHDSMNRVVPADATPEALAQQTAAFLARGGKVQQLPMGLSSYEFTLRPDKPKATKKKIRTEDYS